MNWILKLIFLLLVLLFSWHWTLDAMEPTSISMTSEQLLQSFQHRIQQHQLPLRTLPSDSLPSILPTTTRTPLLSISSESLSPHFRHSFSVFSTPPCVHLQSLEEILSKTQSTLSQVQELSQWNEQALEHCQQQYRQWTSQALLQNHLHSLQLPIPTSHDLFPIREGILAHSWQFACVGLLTFLPIGKLT